MRNGEKLWVVVLWVGLFISGPMLILQNQLIIADNSRGWFPATAQINQRYPRNIHGALSSTEVYFCQRLVDRWLVQLLLPGAEHYSIWLPQDKIHRSVTATWYGQPLYWVDEIYLDWAQPATMPAYLSCAPIAKVDQRCVHTALYRQQDEGVFGLENHCQNVIVDILAHCGEDIPLVVPKLQNWLHY